ncbi:contact-dependent growth inhibition system immunity protein [Mixta calida]|uniref:contact-dependent growth inhibition system immunity protein n=1 Tax=Mixta calida TaxID=665913 RepID=UPI0028A760F5|nr:contact-dependent growth inhibition system immunity protein [Mixta calida]
MNRLQRWRLRHKYSSLRTMIVVFFGQDFDIFGETIEEIMRSYKYDYHDADVVSGLKNEISEMLKTEDDSELIARMELLAENQFDPELWGETWRSFLLRVLAALK